MADQFVQTNMGLLPYDAIVAQINARYAEGKTPDLAVKSALQLGIDPAIIATLPGVDANAMRRGMQLISSGAFEGVATGTQADIQQAAPVGSAQYNARISAGLDAFGFPVEEVRRLTAAGLYGPGKQFDPGDISAPSLLDAQSLAEARELGSTAGAYVGTQPGLVTTSNLNPYDIAYLSKGQGMWGNELLGYDPTSPIAMALQSGIAIPATSFLAQSIGNALGITDASVAANTAVDQAAQGVSESQIVKNLVDLGVNRGTAAIVADAAVSGASPFQIAQDIGGITLTPATQAATTPVTSGVSMSVPVTGSTLPVTAGATGLLTAAPAVVAPIVSGTSNIGMTAPMQTATITGTSAPAATTPAEVVPSLLTTPQIQVTGTNVPKTTATEVAPSLLSVAPIQTATVTGKTVPTQQSGAGTAATQVATTLATIPESVTIEDRKIAREEPQVFVPTPAGTVTTPRGEIPVSEVKIPSTGVSTETPSILPLLGLLGLGAAGASLLGGDKTVPFDQAAYDAIAKGRSPVYPRGSFTPMFGPGGAGMFQIAPTDVYNYFGPPYGAGRFGAVVQPFTLPGLLTATPTMSIPATPSRSTAI